MSESIISIFDNYTVHYTLKESEYRKLVELLSSSENLYNAFLTSFIKEVDGDVSKILRILNVGVKSKIKIFNVSLLSYFVVTLKEAIILANYKDYMDEEGSISILEVSRTIRFMTANIDRHTIIRTFKKYNIEYNYKK